MNILPLVGHLVGRRATHLFLLTLPGRVPTATEYQPVLACECDEVAAAAAKSRLCCPSVRRSCSRSYSVVKICARLSRVGLRKAGVGARELLLLPLRDMVVAAVEITRCRSSLSFCYTIVGEVEREHSSSAEMRVLDKVECPNHVFSYQSVNPRNALSLC